MLFLSGSIVRTISTLWYQATLALSHFNHGNGTNVLDTTVTHFKNAVNLAIGADLLSKHGEVLCEHKQSNEDLEKYHLLVLLTPKNA